MAEYLRVLEPVLSHQEHERTKAIVKQFASSSGLGPILHQYLVDKREAEDNWVIILFVNTEHVLTITIIVNFIRDELFS